MSMILKASKAQGLDGADAGRVNAKIKRTGVAPALPATIEFVCAYGVIGLSSLLYNKDALDITRPTWIFTIILLIMFIVFFVAFKCKEQPVSYNRNIF